MKLHVGCGDVILPGWINVDLENLPGIDLQDDIRELKKVKDGTCDIIYASHVLEHVGRNEFESVLKLWNKKLKLNGILRIAVPNFEKAVMWYTKTKKIVDILGLVSGGQKTKFDFHNMIFDKKFLTDVLKQCGFDEIHEWDWRKVEHGKYDDYSQSYFPHMDKENGILVSLNLEAKKIAESLDENQDLGLSPWRK
jgi:predicted SAM-dependent methyltransferase